MLSSLRKNGLTSLFKEVRVFKERVPGRPESAPLSLKRVRKESESQVLDSFRTLLTLQGALFRDGGGPRPRGLFRDSFRTLPRFRARETLGRILTQAFQAASFGSLPFKLSSQKRLRNELPKIYISVTRNIVRGFNFPKNYISRVRL